MPSATFIFAKHYAQLRFFVAAGLTLKDCKRILRKAISKRRSLVREDPRRFAPYVLREILRVRAASRQIAIDTGARKHPADFVFSIGLARKGPTLEFTEDGVTRYDGGYYAYVGPVIREYKPRKTKANKHKRSARLQAIRELYFKTHHCYPEDKERKRAYEPMHRRMQQHQTSITKQFVAIKKGHERRKIRRKLLTTNISKQRVKFDIRDHYTKPPDEIK